MSKALAAILLTALFLGMAPAQTPQQNQKPKDEGPEDVVRITTSLVQTDVVVTEKLKNLSKVTHSVPLAVGFYPLASQRPAYPAPI
jgi:hypothetical protein